MKRVFSWLFIIIGMAVLVMSTSRGMMKYVSDKRYGWTGAFGIHRADGGDLVNMAFLDKEPKFLQHTNFVFKRSPDTVNRNINLYVWADSYVIHIPDYSYAHVNKFQLGRRDFTDLHYKLDPNKKNILIIENGERFVRIYFKYLVIFDHVQKDKSALSFLYSYSNSPAHYASLGLGGVHVTDLFNPDINQNIEYNLFNYNCINWIRELKAEMNYQYFNRVSGDVALSENGKHLFLRQTIAAHDILSCYEAMKSTEINTLCSNIDTIYKHYKKEGFDEVYFSIIPNPATILQPVYYNGLIPVLEKRADSMGVPFIDIFKAFSHYPNPSELYTNGDTHWNNKGWEIWLDAVNTELNKQSGQLKK
ncbi:hypothetical protein ACPPVU_00900 [Mucilaginibacter sp. McL0603]|uniref:hypothetical protein n=1 Tax=Mucilaginibacter sp. McL0603 TaxID=3415670 RepID=UPI003CF8D558